MTETMLFGKRRPAWPYVSFGHHHLRLRPKVTYLGITIDRRRSYLAHVKRRARLAEHGCRRLYRLLQESGGLSIRNRRRLFRSVLEPTAFYGMELFLLGSDTARRLARRKQRKLLRRA